MRSSDGTNEDDRRGLPEEGVQTSRELLVEGDVLDQGR
jgi:hypothetical protein